MDTETRPHKLALKLIEHRLWFGWACHQRSFARDRWTLPAWYRFTTPVQFWDWVESHIRPRTKLYVFAHNWSFDAPVLDAFNQLPQRGWKLGTAVIEGPPTILGWRRDTARIELLDTLNWWRVPLAKLGESVGVPKLEMPAPTARRKAWDVYCRNDVEVIRRALTSWWEFLRDYDLGGFARTLAGQAMRAYRHRFMRHPILIDNHADATALARSSYHGGRTECFKLGRVDGPIHCLDVNSMYPAVMRAFEYPTVLRLHCKRPSFAELSRWLKSYAVVVRADIETETPQYAHQLKDRLTFPVGRFVATLTTPDVVAALEQGHIRRVHEAALYDRAHIFGEFVETMYKLRLEASARGDGVTAFMLKILLNSLYGKFAQRGTVWETIGAASDTTVSSWFEIDADTGELRSLRSFAGILQQLSREPEAFSSHPAIASHVTAYARRLLWSFMLTAGQGNYVYCDTDSLYVNDVGFERLGAQCDPLRLGALKHEASYDWIMLYGAKDYQTPVGRKAKGVRAKAVWRTDNDVIQEQWSSLVGLVRSGSLTAPTTKTISKHLSREYRKGTRNVDGSVLPLRLREW